MKRNRKKYGVCFFLMAKRLLKKPSFLCLLVLLPVAAIGLNWLEQGEPAQNIIGIVDTENILWTRLQKDQDSLIFRQYPEESSLVQAVETAEVDCGFVLPENFREKLQSDDWKQSIILYESADSVMTAFAKEKIASAAFVMYAEESYVNYINQTEVFDGIEQKGTDRELVAAFAKEAYQRHLADGSTFFFQYQNPIANGKGSADAIEEKEAREIFPVRGILAVCIFLSGMCGLLMDVRDRQEKRFARICPDWVITGLNIWIPTLYTSFITLLTLLVLGKTEHMGREIGSLFLYQFLLIVYCSIIRMILRRQERIAAAIPVLTLASIIFCPVFVRLAAYIPAFRAAERLLPITYYLWM